MKEYKNYIFDLDGTLLSSLEDLVDTRIKRKATGGRSVPVAF